MELAAPLKEARTFSPQAYLAKVGPKGRLRLRSAPEVVSPLSPVMLPSADLMTEPAADSRKRVVAYETSLQLR